MRKNTIRLIAAATLVMMALCGCSAVVLCGHLLKELRRGSIKKLLFCGTGAMLSPTSTQQGESIPGVCHAVTIVSQEVREWTM